MRSCLSLRHPFLPLVALAGLLALEGAPGDRRWSYETGELIFGSASIQGGEVLYFSTEITDGQSTQAGAVYALDISSGSPVLKWRFETGDWVDSAPAISPDGSTVYAGSWDGNLYAIDAETGEEAWSFTTGGIIVASPAVADDGTIYCPSNDGIVYALNPDGSQKWAAFVGAEMDSSPTLDLDGTLYVGTYDGTLVALTPDGGIKWEYTITDEVEVNGEILDNRVLTSPAISPLGEVVFGSGNGFLYSVLASTGALQWKSQFPEEMDSSLAIDEAGNIYAATRAGFLYKLDADGIEEWSNFVGDVFFSSPLIDEKGLAYIIGFAGDNTSAVIAFDAEGNDTWIHTIPAIVDASPTLGPDGTFYVGAYDGTLYAIEAGYSLSTGGWAKFQHDLALTGNLSKAPTPEGFFADFPHASDLGSGWAHSEWAGPLYYPEFPWQYQFPIGWLYEGGPGVSEHWWYHPELEWIWTTPEVFPYAYRHATQAWVYFGTDEQGMAWYYDFNSNSWN
jgi:outer membrane protein assembly factor BamB